MSGNQGKNVQKGKKGFQPTAPQTITPEDAYREIRRRDPIHRLQDWWKKKRHGDRTPGAMLADGTPAWRPAWLPENRPTVVPYEVIISEQPRQRFYITPTGDMMVKQYDIYGAGVGRVRIGRFGYGKRIKKASADSWAEYDRKEARWEASRQARGLIDYDAVPHYDRPFSMPAREYDAFYGAYHHLYQYDPAEKNTNSSEENKPSGAEPLPPQ